MEDLIKPGQFWHVFDEFSNNTNASLFLGAPFPHFRYFQALAKPDQSDRIYLLYVNLKNLTNFLEDFYASYESAMIILCIFEQRYSCRLQNGLNSIPRWFLAEIHEGGVKIKVNIFMQVFEICDLPPWMVTVLLSCDNPIWVVTTLLVVLTLLGRGLVYPKMGVHLPKRTVHNHKG